MVYVLEPHTSVQLYTNNLVKCTKTSLILNGAAPEVQQYRKYLGVFGVDEEGKFKLLCFVLILSWFGTAKKVL